MSTSSVRPAPRDTAGFTLMELMLSTALVSMLMVALVDSLQGFASQLEVVEQSVLDTRYEECMAHMTRSVRQAWLVEEPDDDTLAVFDPYGQQTRFWRDGDVLLVERPSGAKGVLVEGLDDFDVDPQTVRRLRTTTSIEEPGVIFESAPQADITAVSVEQDLPVALGFVLASKAPAELSPIPGVEEIALGATLESVSLPIAFTWVPAPASESGGTDPGDEDDGDDEDDDAPCTDKKCKDKSCKDHGKDEDESCKDGSKCKDKSCKDHGKDKDEDCDEDEDKGKGKGKSSGFGAPALPGGSSGSSFAGKVTICHIPPGNPSNAHTLSVGAPAVAAHLAHGDTLGACGSLPDSDPEPEPEGESIPDLSETIITIELHEGRAPGDGRPYGAPLGSASFPALSLPGGTWAWMPGTSAEVAEESDDGGKSGKAVICHYPPGNPSNARTMSVGAPAVAAHLAHGDTLGPCSGEDVTAATPVLVYNAPEVDVAFDVAAFGNAIEPGRAYTFVVRVDGPGTAILRGAPMAGLTGVAQDSGGSGQFVHAALDVERGVTGVTTYTQTEAIDVISLVTLTLEPQGQDPLVRSAAVLGQTSVSNPWLGPVPGELPTLELSGQ